MKVFTLLIIYFLLIACSASKKQSLNKEEKCLDYEPLKVQIEGELYRKSFPGPPNYADIREGDEEEIYWFIKSAHPFCVNENKKIWGERLTNLSDIQLIIGSELGFYKTKRSLLNKKVIVMGTLIPQISGHHKTEVLLDVQTLDGAKE